MSKESYIRGFCKAAEAAGVDPKTLAKFAQSGPAGVGPLVGNDARKAVQGLYDGGYITEMKTPWLQRLREWLSYHLPTAHWQYKASNPGDISIWRGRANAVPSRLRTAQVLEKHMGEIPAHDGAHDLYRILTDIKSNQPISAYDHGRMMDAIEKYVPNEAPRASYQTVGVTSAEDALPLTRALSESAAKGAPVAAKGAPVAAKGAPVAAKGTANAVRGTGNAVRAFARLFGRR